ncbi:MAG: DNA repair and recombination protein RadB, partial [Candidatus Thermoplasmatota archaeon]
DTEGVSVERLEQISGEKSEKVMENTIFYKPHSFSKQEESIKKGSRLALNSDKDFDLFIVDGFTTFYRPLYNSNEEDRISSRLGRLLIELMKVARKKDIPVVITTQVYESDNGKKPVGGHVLYHNAKTIVLLEVLKGNLRRAILEKHRSLPEGKSARFKIAGNGLTTP